MKLHDTIDVLIGGYMSKDAAEEDYEAVLAQRRRAAGNGARRQGPGRRAVGRTRPTTWFARGAAGLGAVGLAIGLAAPPLLATTAIGAALGGGAGKLLHHKTADKIGEQAGETIPLGGAGLIVVYSKSEAEKVEPAVTRAVQKVEGRGRGAPRQGREGRPRGRPAEDVRRERLAEAAQPSRAQRKPTFPVELSGELPCRAATL